MKSLALSRLGGYFLNFSTLITYYDFLPQEVKKCISSIPRTINSRKSFFIIIKIRKNFLSNSLWVQSLYLDGRCGLVYDWPAGKISQSQSPAAPPFPRIMLYTDLFLSVQFYYYLLNIHVLASIPIIISTNIMFGRTERWGSAFWPLSHPRSIYRWAGKGGAKKFPMTSCDRQKKTIINAFFTP